MKTIDLANKRIIISRTDSIGDVLLTLPMCAWIKNKFSSAHIIFLGKGYTRAIIEAYSLVDQVEDWAEYLALSTEKKQKKLIALNADVIIHVFPNKEIARLAKKAKIKVRVGTSHRSFHRFTCTHRPNFTRRRSDLHEAQLNHELLRPFGMKEIPSLSQIITTTANFIAPDVTLPDEIQKALNQAKKSIVLHPKSQGSAKEWPMEKYLELTTQLVEDDYTVFYTGTADEGKQFNKMLPSNEKIVDTTGNLTLVQLINFISKVDVFCACSTGPLHIAGYLEVKTIGFYSPKRPIHPGRWKALGLNVKILEHDVNCEKCTKKQECNCIQQISVESVLREIV